jgi:hypothetical protein
MKEHAKSGRVRARHLLADYAYALISLFIVDVTSLVGQVYSARNDYALSGVTRDGLDPVGVWGFKSPRAVQVVQKNCGEIVGEIYRNPASLAYTSAFRDGCNS